MTAAQATSASSRPFIHRCYMTGQKCVYLRELFSEGPRDGFLLTPFTESYTHNWTYHLSKLDLGRCGIEGAMKRADSVPRTGYVMCSRICHPIQRSGVILADVTEPNLNVFYELGLTCALGRPLVLLQGNGFDTRVDAFIAENMLSGHCVRYGDDIGHHLQAIASKAKPFSGFGNAARSNGTSPSVLIFSNAARVASSAPPPASRRNVHVSRDNRFVDIIREVFRNPDAASAISQRCGQIFVERGDRHRGGMISEGQVQDYLAKLLKGVASLTRSIASKAEALLNADLIFIDTSFDDFETYFWLGVCHGLQKQVVPLSVEDAEITEPVRPFDVRTLWHVAGTFRSIVPQLQQVAIEIVAQILVGNAARCRDQFWHDIVHSSKLAVYMGTEVSQHLASKQVIGEWDLRTFQTIASFASQANPSLHVRIERPAFRKEVYDEDDRKRFRELLVSRMGNANCVIIGSPDVNPVAEMVLSALKGLEPFAEWTSPEHTVEAPPSRQQLHREGSILEGYVPFKNYKVGYTSSCSSFFVQFNSDEPRRGVIYYQSSGECSPLRVSVAPYTPRHVLIEQAPTEGLLEWDLLGHVVVAPNPFAPAASGLRVLLVMGVGGPATLGLAHLLTGQPAENREREWEPDATLEFLQHSEHFLDRLNAILAERGAVEGIVRTKIFNSKQSVNHAYEDSREIGSIVLDDNLQGLDNPKPFEFVLQQGRSPRAGTPGAGRPPLD